MTTTSLLAAGRCESCRQPFWAQCSACGHHWILLYLPMNARAAAGIMRRATCPYCGGDEQIYPRGPDPGRSPTDQICEKDGLPRYLDKERATKKSEDGDT